MLCLSGFELYSRWVPLFFLSVSSGDETLRLMLDTDYFKYRLVALEI